MIKTRLALAGAALLAAPAAFSQITLTNGSLLGIEANVSTQSGPYEMRQYDNNGALIGTLSATGGTGAMVGTAVLNGGAYTMSVQGAVDRIDLTTGAATRVFDTFLAIECFAAQNDDLLVLPWNSDTVLRYDVAGNQIETITLSLPITATGMDATADRIFAADYNTQEIYEFDLNGTLLQTTTHSLGIGIVSGMAYNPGADTFFLSLGFGSDEVHEIDRAGNSLRSFPSGTTNLNGLELVGEINVGTEYCGPAVANSTGLPGSLEGFGSPRVTTNSFGVRATNLPPGAFTLLVVSDNQGFTPNPGGSAGNLCLGGQLGRFVNQIGQATGGGVFEVTVDLSSLPTPPTFNTQVMAGDTWNFQCWNRDFLMGSATSNFTTGLSVTFL